VALAAGMILRRKTRHVNLWFGRTVGGGDGIHLPPLTDKFFSEDLIPS
jgi:hypothetical protein